MLRWGSCCLPFPWWFYCLRAWRETVLNKRFSHFQKYIYCSHYYVGERETRHSSSPTASSVHYPNYFFFSCTRPLYACFYDLVAVNKLIQTDSSSSSFPRRGSHPSIPSPFLPHIKWIYMTLQSQRLSKWFSPVVHAAACSHMVPQHFWVSRTGRGEEMEKWKGITRRVGVTSLSMPILALRDLNEEGH